MSKTHRFSVEYPQELGVETVPEREGETIVFQKPGEKIGFQIFVSSFPGNAALTRERILEDLPSALIEDPQEVIVASGVAGLLFWSQDPAIGKTRELWFVHGGSLYALTTYAELDEWLARIMSTWKFE